MDLINAFGVLCALVWGVGLFRLSGDMPLLDPAREQICARYSAAGDVPGAASALPAEIGPIAQYGRPYWGTWMPPYTPLEAALPDPYPACMQSEEILAIATARFEAHWAAWREVRARLTLLWAAAPLVGLPLLALAGPLVGLLAPRRPAALPSGTTPPARGPKPAQGAGPAIERVGRGQAGLRRSAATAVRP